MSQKRTLAGVIVSACLMWVAPVSADVVSDWNAIAATAAFTPPGRPGPAAILDLAMVHAAMHDAIQSYQKRFEPYHAAVSGASGSPIVAAARAAYFMLANRFPAQAASLLTTYTTYLTAHSLPTNDVAGELVGDQAALGIIALRANDGSYPPNPEVFFGGTEPGAWRSTPPAFAPMAAPWLGAVVPFILKDSTQLRPDPPPPHLNSGHYAKDYNEVKALGSMTGSTRTAEQTNLAVFYSDNFLTLWQRTLRSLSDAHLDDIGDSARLFALANMASADAIISAWDAKRFYNFWRPITAIREGDNDGNPDTAGDPTWTPFLVTPPYADYTSGANNISNAMARTLANFFGDEMTFSITSLALPQTPANNNPRTYHRFSDVSLDVVEVRIYHGIHFRSADEVARRQGKRAADWAFSHFLRPIE